MSTLPFGKNHAMRLILGKVVEDSFEETKHQLSTVLAKIANGGLSVDQLKSLIKLCNEITYSLNKEIMRGQEKDNRVPHISPRIAEASAKD